MNITSETSNRLATGSRVLFFRLCLSGLLLLAFSLLAQAKDETSRYYKAGKAAFDDGLDELAYKQFERHLKKVDASEENKDVVVMMSQALYRQKKYEELLELLKPGSSWTKKIPDNEAFWFWRAMAWYELGSLDKAIGAVELSRKQYPASEFDDRCERLLAWCYLKAKRTDEALAVFKGFKSKYPDSAEVPDNLLEWSKVLMTVGKSDEARLVLSDLVKMSQTLKTVQEAQYILAQSYLKDEEWAKASRIFTELSGNVMAGDDLRAESWFAIAVAHEAVTNRVEAVIAFSNGMAQAVSPEVTQKARYDLGRFLMNKGRIDEGVSRLKEFVAAAPEHPLAESTQMMLANALLDNGKSQAAINEFQNYLETFTNKAGHVKCYYGKGWALMNEDRYAEAAEVFTKAYKSAENPAMKERCIYKVGDAQYANSQLTLARATYKKLISEFPESHLVVNAKYQVAECYATSGKFGKAAKEFDHLRVKHPKSALDEEVMLRIAEMHMAGNRLPEAVTAYSEMMQVYSKGSFFADAIHGRGLAYYRDWKMDDALADFARVVKDYPLHKAAERSYYMQGMCSYWQGKDKDALRYCQEFLVKYPESKWKSDVLYWLGNYHYNHDQFALAESNMLNFATQFSKKPMADDALLWAGMAAFKQKEYIRAVESLTRLIKEFPESAKIADARFTQANAFCELDRFPEAILIYDEILHKYEKSKLLGDTRVRKADCEFMLGAKDSKRYEASIKLYRAVAVDSETRLDLALQSEYKIGRCLEKLGRSDEAFEQYYLKVVYRYYEDQERGVWYSPEAKRWFTRAAFNAVDIMKAKKEWRRVVSILERVSGAGVPESEEASKEIDKIKSEHWWLFYKQ